MGRTTPDPKEDAVALLGDLEALKKDANNMEEGLALFCEKTPTEEVLFPKELEKSVRLVRFECSGDRRGLSSATCLDGREKDIFNS